MSLLAADPSFTALADAVQAALIAADVAGGRVFHIYPTQAALSTTAVAVGIAEAEPRATSMNGAPVDWRTTLRVDCYAQFGVNHPRPHGGITALFAAAYAALMHEPTLGGLAMGMEPGPVSWGYADDEQQLAVVKATFAVLHRTNFGAV